MVYFNICRHKNNKKLLVLLILIIDMPGKSFYYTIIEWKRIRHYLVYQSTYKKIVKGKTPISLRIIAYLITITHLVLIFTYFYVILYSSDLKTLYLVLFGCFILYELSIYFKGCISNYEKINTDIIPSLSEFFAILLLEIPIYAKTPKNLRYLLFQWELQCH